MSEQTGISWILQEIRSLLADPAINRLSPDCLEPAWDSPLIGVSRGDDPLYQEFRGSIGLFYRKPLEAFRAAADRSDAAEPSGGQ